MQNKEKIIIAFIIGIIIGLIIGYGSGVNMCVNKGVYLAKVMMDDGTINFSYDSEVLRSLINRYVSSAKLQ